MNLTKTVNEKRQLTIEDYTHYDSTYIRFKTAKLICSGKSQESGHIWGRRSDSKSTRGKCFYGFMSELGNGLHKWGHFVTIHWVVYLQCVLLWTHTSMFKSLLKNWSFVDLYVGRWHYKFILSKNHWGSANLRSRPCWWEQGLGVFLIHHFIWSFQPSFVVAQFLFFLHKDLTVH